MSEHGEIRGHLDFSGQEWSDFGRERKMEIMPKGARWPWYPRFVGTAWVQGRGLNMDFEFRDGPDKKRVGLRRSFKNAVRFVRFKGWSRD